MIEVTTSALAGHPFLHGMPREHLDALVTAVSGVTFPARHYAAGRGCSRRTGGRSAR